MRARGQGRLDFGKDGQTTAAKKGHSAARCLLVEIHHLDWLPSAEHLKDGTER